MVSILYVEDTEGNYKPMTEFLQLEGYEVHWTDNLEEAKRLYKVKQPDIVLTDGAFFADSGGRINKDAGLELARFVKQGNRPETKVLWLSGNDTPAVEVTAAGVDYPLFKPVDPERIFKILAECSAALGRSKG